MGSLLYQIADQRARRAEVFQYIMPVEKLDPHRKNGEGNTLLTGPGGSVIFPQDEVVNA